MALQSLPRGLVWPGVFMHGQGSNGQGNSITMDAAGEYTAFVDIAEENMVISHVGFKTGTVAGSPTIEVRIETVDATTGLPTGTLWSTTTNVTSGTLSSNTWTLVALTSSATINVGDVFAVVFKYASGTSVILQTMGQMGFQNTAGLPYTVNNTGTPAKANSALTCLALGSSATSFYTTRTTCPISTTANGTRNTSTGTAIGARFKLPFPCRVSHIIYLRVGGTGGYAAAIYSDAGSELNSSATTVDPDETYTGVAMGVTYIPLAAKVELAANTWYRALMVPNSASDVWLTYWDAPSTNYLSAMPGGGFWNYTQSNTSGVFDDTLTTRVPMLNIIIDQLDDGVSAASGGGIKLAGRGGLAG